jgi:hypothetical protein
MNIFFLVLWTSMIMALLDLRAGPAKSNHRRAFWRISRASCSCKNDLLPPLGVGDRLGMAWHRGVRGSGIGIRSEVICPTGRAVLLLTVIDMILRLVERIVINLNQL